MRNLKQKIYDILPKFLTRTYHVIKHSTIVQMLIYRCYGLRYRFILHHVRRKVKKDTLNVVFLATYSQGWKYERLYRELEKDIHFSPIVLVCPTVNRGYEKMIEVLDDTYAYFLQKGYQVVMTYNKGNGKCIDIKEFHPDLVFFTNPYDGLMEPKYFINKIKCSLTFYISYGIEINPYDWCYALNLHQRVWRHFLGVKEDIEYVKKWCPWAVSNRVVTGYPTYETITQGSSLPSAWKNTDRKYKRIIYAPHHTIEGNTGLLHFSSFLMYGDFMLELAHRYRDRIQFVFKPHPLLQFNLENHHDWGKERTDAYYRQWKEGENTNFVNGEYIDLFNSSDGMVHDCVSFMFEYMCTQKPVMFLANAIDMDQYNKLGIALYESHYKAKSKEDIIQFIEDVIIEGKDDMSRQRNDIFTKYILPPNGCTATENIMNEIKKELIIQ